MQNKWLGVVLICVFIAGIYAALNLVPRSEDANSGLGARTNTQYLKWYPQARALVDFELTAHDGNAFTKDNLQGKWTLAFVGYTYCPDICPVTLADVAKIYPDLLKHVGDTPFQVWFLSVDPKRDTAERLKEYIGYFNPDFVATTGSHKYLFPLVRSLGLMYAMREDTEKENYLVDHSASVVVIDPRANVVGRFQPKLEPGKLAVSDPSHILADVPVLLASE